MEQAREYGQTTLYPRILKEFRNEIVNKEQIKEMGKLGFLGCMWKEYDLPGVSNVAYGTFFVNNILVLFINFTIR